MCISIFCFVALGVFLFVSSCNPESACPPRVGITNVPRTLIHPTPYRDPEPYVLTSCRRDAGEDRDQSWVATFREANRHVGNPNKQGRPRDMNSALGECIKQRSSPAPVIKLGRRKSPRVAMLPL